LNEKTKETIMSTEMLAHLSGRCLDPSKYSGVAVDVDSVTFPLWNLSGQMVGYQVYKPNAEKNHQLAPRDQRYFTYVTRAGGKEPALAVWGIETVSSNKPLYLVEGVFDACKLHNLGLSAVAVLSCDPKHLKSWLATLPQKKVAVCEGDAAGRKLAKFGNSAVFLPEGKDVGSLNDEELATYFSKDW
jgi:hypothetical protein